MFFALNSFRFFIIHLLPTKLLKAYAYPERDRYDDYAKFDTIDSWVFLFIEVGTQLQDLLSLVIFFELFIANHIIQSQKELKA